MSPDIVDGKGKFVMSILILFLLFFIAFEFLQIIFKYFYSWYVDDGFYRLKKDSERRVMLVRVLETERSQICNHWEELILNDLPSGKETSITKV